MVGLEYLKEVCNNLFWRFLAVGDIWVFSAVKYFSQVSEGGKASASGLELFESLFDDLLSCGAHLSKDLVHELGNLDGAVLVLIE